jgi:hypothetical protein
MKPAPLRPNKPYWQFNDTVFDHNTLSYQYVPTGGGRASGIFVMTSYYSPRESATREAYWHIQISCMWRKPREDEVRAVLEDFGAMHFGERRSRKDLVRNFFYPHAEDEPTLT